MASDVDKLIREITTFQIQDAGGNGVAGLDAVRKPNGTLWATNFWVAEAYRGSWYGIGLIRRLIARFGHETIYCEAFPYTDRPLDTERLVKFYGVFGFKPTEVPGILMRQSSDKRDIQN